MDRLHTSPRFLSPAHQLRLPVGVTVALYQPRSDDQLHMHAHACDCINVVLEGMLYERVDEAMHTLPSGSLSVLPRHTEHAVRVAGRNAQVLHLEYEPVFMARFPVPDRSQFEFVTWLDSATRSLAQRAATTLLHPDPHSSQMFEALSIEAMSVPRSNSTATSVICNTGCLPPTNRAVQGAVFSRCAAPRPWVNIESVRC